MMERSMTLRANDFSRLARRWRVRYLVADGNGSRESSVLQRQNAIMIGSNAPGGYAQAQAACAKTIAKQAGY